MHDDGCCHADLFGRLKHAVVGGGRALHRFCSLREVGGSMTIDGKRVCARCVVPDAASASMHCRPRDLCEQPSLRRHAICIKSRDVRNRIKRRIICVESVLYAVGGLICLA